MQLALEMPIDGRAWFLLARAAIWALLAIAVAVDSLPKER